MKTVNFTTRSPAQELVTLMKNSNAVNDGVKFGDGSVKPVMRVRERGERIFITCEMVGGASRDNGFIVGTFFLGRVRERGGETSVRGIILTAPLFHLIMLSLIGVFIYQCIRLGGFSIIPVCIALFGFLLMKNEYKKQGIIKRYIARAIRRLDEKEQSET
ncbi:MAG: hypothetical protein IKA64_02435 [Clostridia bacterium]|nr:hypothetical protein [Clostridia bacterium]